MLSLVLFYTIVQWLCCSIFVCVASLKVSKKSTQGLLAVGKGCYLLQLIVK